MTRFCHDLGVSTVQRVFLLHISASCMHPFPLVVPEVWPFDPASDFHGTVWTVCSMRPRAVVMSNSLVDVAQQKLRD